MYYTATDSTGFFRSLRPIVETTNGGKDTLTETVTSTSTTLAIKDSSGAYHDLGFYYSLGGLTLGKLASLPHGLTVAGTGQFAINLWFSPGSFVWSSSNIFQNVGTGNYGLGPNNGAGS